MLPTASVVPLRTLARLHVAVVLFGFAGLFGKWLVLSPLVIVFARAAIAALVLALSGRSVPTAPDVRLVAGGVVLAVHWCAFFAAIQMSTVATGLVGYASFPLFTLLLERWLLHVRWRASDWAAAGLVLGGLVLLSGLVASPAGELRGLGWGVAAGASFAWLAVNNRAQVGTRSAREIALWQNAVAALCLLPGAAIGLAAAPLPGVHDIALLAVLGIACTALAHTAFIASLRTTTAFAASVAAAFEPLYGIALAWTLLAERPHPGTWIAAILLVIAAIVVATRPAPVAVPA